MKKLIHLLIVIFLFSACAKTQQRPEQPMVSVSVPAMKYFVERLASDSVCVNVMVPSAAGHSAYTPRPAQMLALAQSSSYLAFGCLDFELTWRERMQNAAPDMRWADMSQNINLIHGHMCSAHCAEHHHHAADPHYWLSPRQALVLAQNIAEELKTEVPNASLSIDSALFVFSADIQKLDSTFVQIAQQSENKAFMIYHPALSYLARDYGFSQMEVEKDGSEPSPQSYMAEIECAREAGAKVVFVQKGYDLRKAEQAAEAIGAQVVEFSPEGENWLQTMQIIAEALCR